VKYPRLLMSSSWRRLLLLLAAMPIIVMVVAVLYMLGMQMFEHDPRTFWQSLEWASETMTSTGYGRDNHWNHPMMVVFVVTIQFFGLAVVFVLFPLALIPFFERYFEQRLARTLPEQRNDYVLIYRHGPAVNSLIAELGRHEVPVVILEEDEGLARRLRERGNKVVHGGFTDDDFELGSMQNVRAIIANGKDHDNASMIVSARQEGYKGPIYAFVEKPSHRRPMVLAGATAAYTPRHVLAAALAAKASERIAPRVGGVRHLSAHLEVSDLRIHKNSELAGKTLVEANIRARTGATVVGHWGRGDFVALPRADSVLEAGALILAVGSDEAIARLGKLATPLSRRGGFLICGYGEVGFKVAQMLRDVGEKVTVIDRRDIEGVDVVGDALDPRTLRKANITESRAVILALDAGPTLLAASMLRDLAPEVLLIARVNRAENVARVRQAGVDFAMSISQIAAQILTQQLLGEQSISLEPNVKLTRVSATGLAGKTPHESKVSQQTGCAIVAIERDDNVLVEFGAGFTIQKHDIIYICGSHESVMDYFKAYPQPRDPALEPSLS